MKKLLIPLIFLSAAAFGQTGPFVITATTSPCAQIGIGAKTSQIAIVVTGSFSGTLQPELSLQGQTAANTQVTPSTSSTAASTITAAGTYFTVNVAGADTFFLCPTAFASGTATVYLNNSTAGAAHSGGGGSGGSGTVTSIATTSPITGGTITTTGTIACATCAVGPGSSSANHLAKFSGTDGLTLADGGAIPAGTVTSVAVSSPLGGGPITSTGTLTCATCTITVGSGTVTVTGDAPTTGACASEHTASVTGLLTTDVVHVGFNGDPSAVTGIAPTTSGGVYILAYPKSAGTLGLKVCNDTTSTITVGTLVLNYWVAR